MKAHYIFLFAAAIITACITPGTYKGKPDKIDFSLYQGTWYEIARLPNSFEDGLICITSMYSYGDDGIILFTNKGLNKNNPADVRTITGRAWIPDPEHPENIKVQFVWPVTADYRIIHVNESAGLAIIGSSSGKLLWFLSRKESIEESDMRELENIARKNQFRTDNLIIVEHGCGK